MRRASRSAPSDAAPACRSRDRALDTVRAARHPFGPGDIELPARLPVANVHERDGPHTGRHHEGDTVDRARAATGGKAKDLAGSGLGVVHNAGPEAPRPAADGSVTAMAKYIATAASVALRRRATRRGRSPPPGSRRLQPPQGTPPRSRALSGSLRALRPAGFVTFCCSVSLPPQPDSKNTAISARLRN